VDELAQKQKAFTDLKNTKTGLDNSLREIKSLKTQIEREEGQSHPASMYFLTKELKKILEDLKIPSADELSQRLNQGWSDLNKAQDAVNKKKMDLDGAKAKYEAQQKKVSDLWQKRRENILGQLKPWDTPQTGHQATQSAA